MNNGLLDLLRGTTWHHVAVSKEDYINVWEALQGTEWEAIDLVSTDFVLPGKAIVDGELIKLNKLFTTLREMK